MHWYFSVLSKYAVFSGRARRQEYWCFALTNLIISLMLLVIQHRVLGSQSQWLTNIYSLALLLPSLAVSMRRLHDIGRSGWWMWIMFIPVVGVLILLVFHCQDSQAGSNQYGPSPKDA
ncbi:membrane protein [Chromobacterium piscinae]|nr:membrane protein [Chromobacterium piscinae]